MVEIVNGMPAASLDPNRWRKSSHSGAVGNCVELTHLPDGRIAVRNSRDPKGPALIHPRAGLVALVRAIEEGVG